MKLSRRAAFITVIALLAMGAQSLAPAWSAAHDGGDLPTGTVLITGSNRGIGLGFAREYARRGWQVIATCRSPAKATELQVLADQYPRFRIEALDVTDAAEIAALAARYRSQPIDVLINNAAFLGEVEPQQFGQLDYELFERAVDVNLLGPLRVSEAFVEQVAASRQKKIVILGTAASSHGILGPGLQLYAYRASKAGLHMAADRMAIDLAPRGIIVALLNPGLVDTKGVMDLKPGEPVPDVFEPLMPLIESGEMEMLRPSESAAALANIIAALTAQDAGRFIDVDGQEIPW